MPLNPLVTILVRTRNAGVLFGELLGAVDAQTVTDRELVIVDSRSTDGTPDLAARHGARVVPLDPARFTHALSTNMGFEAARGQFVVSLSQDATPDSPAWLERLLAAVAAPDVAAAYGRQLPRPGCFVVERLELARAYPEDPTAPGRAQFSNANSIVRRAIWQRRPFDEALAIAEDLEWARWALSEGQRVLYVPTAAVWHSHNYTLGQFYRRCREEGSAMSAFAGFRPGLRTLMIGWPRQALADLRALGARGELGAWPRACAFRFAQLLGNYRGARQRP